MTSHLWKGITFGVELEFMTPTPYHSLWSSSAPIAAARYHIANLFAKRTSFPVACECTHEIDEKCPVCTEMDILGGVGFISRPEVPTDMMLKNACFLFKPEFFDYRNPVNAQRCWPGVEICTPVLGEGELSSGLATVKTALSTIRQIGVDITADESCGMHVHVGVEEGMTLHLAKKIATLVALLENTLLLPLVAPSRWTTEWTTPICEGSQAAVQDEIPARPEDVKAFQKHVPLESTMYPSTWNGEDPKTFYKMLRTIWACKGLKELSSALKRGGICRCGLAIALRDQEGEPVRIPFADDFEGTPSTVEFRYSQMTFDHVLLRNWTEVVARIVALARAEEKEFKTIVEMIIGLNYEADVCGMSAWKLLLKRVLGLEHRIVDWEAQLEKFERGEYISFLDAELLLQPEE
ncbi:hypothetical protein ACLX1H_010849 [Fusarium chlamydosporum]